MIVTSALNRFHKVAWQAFLALAVWVSALYLVSPSVAVRDMLTVFMGFAAVIAIGCAVPHFSQRRLLFGVLFMLGVAASAAGDVIWGINEVVLGKEILFPSSADILYLAQYPLMGASLWVLLQAERRTVTVGMIIDWAIIATAIGLLVWVWLIEPSTSLDSVHMTTKIVAALYPALGMLLLSAMVVVYVRGSAPSPVFVLMSLGVAVEVIAGSAFAISFGRGTYQTGLVFDVGWLLMYGLFGAAALHPTLRIKLSKRDRMPSRPLSTRLAFLLLACLIVPAVTLLQHPLGITVSFTELLIVSISMSLLIFARMALLAQGLQKAEHILLRSHEQLGKSHLDRRRLLQTMVWMEERERIRMSSMLHDGPIQRLSALGYQLGTLEATAGSVHDAAAIRTINDYLSEEIRWLRNIMQNLRPPALEEQGLESAISDHIAQFRDQTGVDCTVEFALTKRLDQSAETALYRVVQESLLNIAKHSKASKVAVTLRHAGDDIYLGIEDNGYGFDINSAERFVQDGHYGIAIMRERLAAIGGGFNVTSHIAGGTAITATVSQRSKKEPSK